MLQNLPWYSYILIAFGFGVYVYRFFRKVKEEAHFPDLSKAQFRKDLQSKLTEEELFSVSLDMINAEWWKVPINTLAFEKTRNFNKYLEGWGIDTADGYWDLTNYFIKDGRRWYFDFIYHMIQTEPEEKWNSLVHQKYGDNNRAQRYLNMLKTGEVQEILKNNGAINFDSEIEVGVAGYDASILVGHARRAYAANLISESEAWKVIDFATQLAKEHFSSWQEFGKSYILGFTLDIRDKKDGYHEEIYHIYNQVLDSPESPWNTIEW